MPAPAVGDARATRYGAVGAARGIERTEIAARIPGAAPAPPIDPNHLWGADLLGDALVCGRRLGLVTIEAVFTRDALSIELDVDNAVPTVTDLVAAGNLDTTFELTPRFRHDCWLHALTAAIAAYLGFGPVPAGDTAQPGASRTA